MRRVVKSVLPLHRYINNIVNRSCLDDEELEFLIGISWIEYCQVAHREGLDVLRYTFYTTYLHPHLMRSTP